MSDARASVLIPSFSFLRRGATWRFMTAYETRCTHEWTVGRATYFCRTPSRSPLALSLFCDPIHPSLFPRDSAPSFILAEDNLSFLSLILYSLSFISQSLPRQADANGIMHRELVSYRLSVCLIFFHWSRIAPRMVPSSSFVRVCMCARASPFSPSPLPRSPVPASFLSSSRSVRCCATR